VRLDEGTIDILGAERPGVTDFGARKPHGEGPDLPMPDPWRQSQLNKPVIGRMSAELSSALSARCGCAEAR
jgi:hypothetical protein